MLSNNYTKEELADIRLCGADISLFLRLAHLRIENHPEALPFKPVQGHVVLNWLSTLASRYGSGEDISK